MRLNWTNVLTRFQLTNEIVHLNDEKYQTTQYFAEYIGWFEVDDLKRRSIDDLTIPHHSTVANFQKIMIIPMKMTQCLLSF